MEEQGRSTLAELVRWYSENCDGDWEHQYGVSVTTMDNPGWDVKIDVAETILCDLQVQEEYEGPRTPMELLPAIGYDVHFDWYKIWIEGGMYRAYCSPRRLGFVLDRFLEHVREAEARLGGIYPKD